MCFRPHLIGETASSFAKISYLQIKQHSKDYSYIEIGNQRNGVCKGDTCNKHLKLKNKLLSKWYLKIVKKIMKWA